MAATNKFLNEEMKPKLDLYRDSVAKMEDHYSRRVEAGANDVEQQYRNGRLLLIVLTVAALLVGVGFAIGVTRSIKRQLGGCDQVI